MKMNETHSMNFERLSAESKITLFKIILTRYGEKRCIECGCNLTTITYDDEEYSDELMEIETPFCINCNEELPNSPIKIIDLWREILLDELPIHNLKKEEPVTIHGRDIEL